MIPVIPVQDDHALFLPRGCSNRNRNWFHFSIVILQESPLIILDQTRPMTPHYADITNNPSAYYRENSTLDATQQLGSNPSWCSQTFHQTPRLRLLPLSVCFGVLSCWLVLAPSFPLNDFGFDSKLPSSIAITGSGSSYPCVRFGHHQKSESLGSPLFP